ncbi:hypothetical protein IQ07DRAFT_568342 [Pyrenochaeta sp. DS3sAY3a]|nr:hypothetical protein IQ07DRAFT_568342 [Pyrenochaeta sp. DS3sAY3a]
MSSPSGSSEVELPREPSSSSSAELPRDHSSSSREIELPPSPPSSSSSSPLPSPFKDVFASLPASGPTTHAHIFELSDYSSSSNENQRDADRTISLQDAVVTILFHISPDTLESFLSPRVHTFKAIFGKKGTQLVIWRKGLEVFIGTFTRHTALKVFGFDHVVGLLIGYDGSWHLKATTGNAFSAPKWPDIWLGKFEGYAGMGRMSVEVEEEDMARRAGRLAEQILEERFWMMEPEVTMG